MEPINLSERLLPITALESNTFDDNIDLKTFSSLLNDYSIEGIKRDDIKDATRNNRDSSDYCL
jgi:hypothetical protein